MKTQRRRDAKAQRREREWECCKRSQDWTRLGFCCFEFFARVSGMETASRKSSVEKLQRPGIVSAIAWEDAGVEARKCLIDLASRLGMDSSNSSMPPSSDGPGSASGSTDEAMSSKAKKKSGGQPGHPRHERPLTPTDECDDVHILRPETCNQRLRIVAHKSP